MGVLWPSSLVPQPQLRLKWVREKGETRDTWDQDINQCLTAPKSMWLWEKKRSGSFSQVNICVPMQCASLALPYCYQALCVQVDLSQNVFCEATWTPTYSFSLTQISFCPVIHLCLNTVFIILIWIMVAFSCCTPFCSGPLGYPQQAALHHGGWRTDISLMSN